MTNFLCSIGLVTVVVAGVKLVAPLLNKDAAALKEVNKSYLDLTKG